MPNPLDAINAELDDLDQRMNTLLADPEPARAVDALLAAVHAAHPGAWMPVHQLADYKTDRAAHRAARTAATQLINAHRAQLITVAFGQARRQLIRHPHHDTVDLAAVQAAASAALAPVGYQAHIRPARLVSTNFEPVTLTHDNRPLTAYRWARPYTVAVTPASQKQTSP